MLLPMVGPHNIQKDLLEPRMTECRCNNCYSGVPEHCEAGADWRAEVERLLVDAARAVIAAYGHLPREAPEAKALYDAVRALDNQEGQVSDITPYSVEHVEYLEAAISRLRAELQICRENRDLAVESMERLRAENRALEIINRGYNDIADERDAMRPVVDAARAFVLEVADDGLESESALIDAVRALDATQ